MLDGSSAQPTDTDWFDYFLKSGTSCKLNTCRKNDPICECYLTIEYDLSMLYKGFGSPAIFLKPQNGTAVNFNTGEKFNEKIEDSFILTDGFNLQKVISINGRFPGPTITSYENQNMIVHVRNLMHTDSMTIHWHGMHQRSTPEEDGVAFITQYPILPGQNQTYKFKAFPFGTHFYHAHIGDQRTMGLYGPLIVIPEGFQQVSQPQEGNNVFIAVLQDWNHDDSSEVLYQKLLWGDYDRKTGKAYNVTNDHSGAKYSRFRFHSGLINGRGRYYSSSTENNEAPLYKFIVEKDQKYRFRVINAATMYPFHVYVEKHRPLYIVASDGREIQEEATESFIIHPGERIDFMLHTDNVPSTYLLVAESLEVGIEQRNEYHAAEALIFYKSSPTVIDLNPPKADTNNCNVDACKVFNCPFEYYPEQENRYCFNFNNVASNDPNSQTDEIKGKATELFFNFGFPGEKGYTPGSVNGHQFRSPIVNALAQPNQVDYNCRFCNASNICKCTYSVTIDRPKDNNIYQLVLTNIGNGSGWSHPIHLHGHSFYIMKIGFGKYDITTGNIISNGGQDTIDIICNDKHGYCNDAKWRNESWSEGKHPDLNWKDPPQKDTIIVPTGSYVIIRFKADNPGVWFLHCHIDLHNTNGMGMIINELPELQRNTDKDAGKKSASYYWEMIGILIYSIVITFILAFHCCKKKRNYQRIRNYNGCHLVDKNTSG
ncbi:Hypothetical predicted protein, partial [Mytilus galloprovincialis]